MNVDYKSVREALERHDHKIPGQPEVEVILSDPDENGISVMALDGPGSFHAEPEGILIALGLPPTPAIVKRSPESTAAHVVSEPARPPSPRAARASRRPRGRTVPTKKAGVQPPPKADLIEANVAPKPRPRRPRQGRK